MSKLNYELIFWRLAFAITFGIWSAKWFPIGIDYIIHDAKWLISWLN